MIQEQYKSNVQEVSKGTVSTGFNIEINESMFQMLTSKVYNDPTLAVIREWSTNACDACIVAKKQPKYDVHIPTESELYFSVRDYGTGLHPDDVVGLFSTLGSSTKRNSNELNGTFGIGRMAGLAVSSGFSVDSYYEGTVYSYAISVQNGVPVTISLGEQKTTEPNGLKLSVAVDIDDVYHYEVKAKDLYKYFDHKPTLNVQMDIELDITEHISDDWFIKSNSHRGDNSNCVVMAQVSYTIPDDSKLQDHGFRNLVIKAPSGSVSFNPGRESLSLTKETISYINKRFSEIKDEYVHSAIMAISEGSNDREVNAVYTKVVTNAPSELYNLIKPEPFYSQYLNSMTSGYFSSSVCQTQEFGVLTNHKINLGYKCNYRKSFAHLGESVSIKVNNLMTTPHVVVDLKTRFKPALNIEYHERSAICWSRQDGVEIEDFLVEVKKVTKALGVTYVLASELVTKHSTTCLTDNTVKAPREGLYSSTLNTYSGSFGKSSKMAAEASEAHTYLYVKLNNTDAVINHPTLALRDFITIYGLLKKIRIMPVIRGVPKKYQHIADKLDNWVDFEEFVLARVKETPFKVPLPATLPKFVKERISYGSLRLYPQVIQDYYCEVQDYQKFNSSKDFIESQTYVELLKSVGANFYSYTPTRDVDLEVVENSYAHTMKLLTINYFMVDCPEYFIAGIAKLEEENALRSTS